MNKYRATHYTKKKPLRAKYILKNITKNDINLGDLRYKIPAGKARDLLSDTAHLDLQQIYLSATSGSISKRLGNGLVLTQTIFLPKAPAFEEAKGSTVFPQRVKTSLIIDVSDITEEIQHLIMDEDEEVLRKLEEDSNYTGEDMAPIVSKKED